MMSVELLSFIQLSRQDSVSGRVFFQPCSQQIWGGDSIVLNGVSGSGKSVFLRTLALLETPSSGEIYYQQRLVNSKNVSHYRSEVAYLRQHPELIKGSVEENIRLPWSFRANQQKAFDRAQLENYLSALNLPSSFLQQESANLSGGERQLCSLLRTLMLNPRLLLLDEPTSALDTVAVGRVEALLSSWLNSERAMVWVSHDEAQKQRMAKKCWLMQNGNLSFQEATS